MQIPNRRAGSLSLPPIGLGTMWLQGDDARDGVAHALSLGYRLLDTSHKYGNEAEVGAGIRAASVARDDIIVVTKLPVPSQPDEVGDATRTSLGKLGLDVIDVMLIHWPDVDTPRDEVLAELDTLRTQGLIREAGVSNFPPSMLDTAVGVAPVAVHQFEYHPLLSQDVLLERAERYDHAVMAYTPLARGRLVDDATLAYVGRAHGKSPSQVALRWLIQQERIVAIPGSNDPARREENLAIFDFSLTDDEMARITALDREERVVNPPHAPDWER